MSDLLEKDAFLNACGYHRWIQGYMERARKWKAQAIKSYREDILGQPIVPLEKVTWRSGDGLGGNGNSSKPNTSSRGGGKRGGSANSKEEVD